MLEIGILETTVACIIFSGLRQKIVKMAKTLAAKHVSCDEVLQDILSDDQSNDDTRLVEANADEVIGLAIRELRVLRSQMFNFVAFEQEVARSLHGLYARWEERCPYSQRILNSTITVGSLIAEEVCVWLKIIRRRLSARVKARNPWTLEFSRYLSLCVFLKIKEVTTASSTSFGLVIDDTVKETVISFTDKRRLLRDLEIFSEVERSQILSLYLTKDIKGKGRVAVSVLDEKPFILKYNKRKCEVVVKCHYTYENQFGYIFG